MTQTASFFTFRQNNSGGSFEHDDDLGIGYVVCVEADNATMANARAEEIGLYFDGCADDRDCPCCGDRWWRADDFDADESPALYGGPIKGGWGIPSYIHYADGRVERVEP